jgi:hypothetical protein
MNDYSNVILGMSDEVAWPTDIYGLVMEIEGAVSSGDRQTAMALLSKLEQSPVFTDDSLNAISKLELLANIANAYIRLREYEIAALKMEDVCVYAAKIDPHNVKTALDYRALAQLRERSGNLAGALEAIEQGIRVLESVKGFTRSVSYYTDLDGYRSHLRQKIEKLNQPKPWWTFWKKR